MSRKPPPDLSLRSAALWRAALRSGSRAPGRLALLEEALRSLDAADRYRSLLAEQDLVVPSKAARCMCIRWWRPRGRRLKFSFGSGASDDQIDGNDRVSPYTSPPYGRYFQAGHQDQENEEPR
jgi:hypothetical protein